MPFLKILALALFPKESRTRKFIKLYRAYFDSDLKAYKFDK